jgi:hypothetical protein
MKQALILANELAIERYRKKMLRPGYPQTIHEPESKIAPIDWDCFTPSAVKLFEGVVYRGTSSEPNKVFKQGFEDYNPSYDVSNYFKPRNLDVGVSTSRSFKVAEKYTRVSSRQGKSRFVYTIIYRGIGGVDIIETAKAKVLLLRDLTNPQLTRALEKDEVNFIEKIAPEQIYCVTEFLPNGTEKTTYTSNARS